MIIAITSIVIILHIVIIVIAISIFRNFDLQLTTVARRWPEIVGAVSGQ